MKLCDYGCGQKAKFQFKNGKWCCSESHSNCPEVRRKNSENSKGDKHHYFGKKRSEETKKKISKSNKGKCSGRVPWNKGKTYEELYGKEKAKELKRNHSDFLKGGIPWNKLTIDYIKQYHPLFSKIEEMRYNPEVEGEIQVHCKNHNCPNSKEKGGWFTPSKIQIQERMRQIESEYGQGGSYFYCCDECKNECPLFNLKTDPFKDISKPYTQEEYQQFREHVLKRDNYICQYCGKLAEHVHHIKPQKLEPFHALDPDYAISVCKDCHYRYGHKDECSTGNLSKYNCRSII